MVRIIRVRVRFWGKACVWPGYVICYVNVNKMHFKLYYNALTYCIKWLG